MTRLPPSGTSTRPQGYGTVGTRSSEDGQEVWREEELEGTRNSGLTTDETALLKLEDHPVDGGWGDLEEALHVGFGGGTTVDLRVRVDESQVLALKGRERGVQRGAPDG